MHRRTLNGVASVFALVGTTVLLSAQEPAAPERLGRCFTPITLTGVYFEVTADGPTERLLRMVADTPLPKVKHSQVHVTATAHARVPTADQLGRDAEYMPTHSSRAVPPAIHSVRVHTRGETPTLLTPQVVVDAAPSRTHRHESVFTVPTENTDTTSVDVVVVSAMGSTGCRLRFKLVR
jgi:hypothetical protein